ncbi:hypothetical protein GUJ93_ZPchr0004g40041 [Zizania palustris]|uniref:Uncharacterized protein n=1 Tax=Zizania palustris TaxID=103762 RepID=A0A8J5S5A8_ZIZPA|nr:hypothetical protein GUJ93_ZPchr0004g40041 [Zizania palustris]
MPCLPAPMAEAPTSKLRLPHPHPGLLCLAAPKAPTAKCSGDLSGLRGPMGPGLGQDFYLQPAGNMFRFNCSLQGCNHKRNNFGCWKTDDTGR